MKKTTPPSVPRQEDPPHPDEIKSCEDAERAFPGFEHFQQLAADILSTGGCESVEIAARGGTLTVHVGLSEAVGEAGPPPPPPDGFWETLGKFIKLNRIAEILAETFEKFLEMFFRPIPPNVNRPLDNTGQEGCHESDCHLQPLPRSGILH